MELQGGKNRPCREYIIWTHLDTKTVHTQIKVVSSHNIWKHTNTTQTLLCKASYWCCCDGPGRCPQCRFCLRRTWCHCLHTSWVMGCVRRQPQGDRTWSSKKLGSSLWAALCDSLGTEDEELRSSLQSWRGRKTGGRAKGLEEEKGTTWATTKWKETRRLKYTNETDTDVWELLDICSHIIYEDSQLLGNWGDGLTDDPEIFSVCHQTFSLTGSDRYVHCWHLL